MKNFISQITMEELERTVSRALQKSFSEAMGKILLEMDTVIAENRDKRRLTKNNKSLLNQKSIHDTYRSSERNIRKTPAGR